MTPITPQDVINYISAIRVFYPKAFPISSDPKEADTERAILIKMLFNILREYPKEVCDVAVENLVKNFNYEYPKPADIVAEIKKLQLAYEKSDSDLWAELTTCVRKVQEYDYYRSQSYVYMNGEKVSPSEEIKKLYQNLTPELREFVGGIAGLVSLSRQESLEFERGRFLKVVPTIKERAKIRSSTPESLAGLIQGLSVHLQIDCDDTKLLKGD